MGAKEDPQCKQTQATLRKSGGQGASAQRQGQGQGHGAGRSGEPTVGKNPKTQR